MKIKKILLISILCVFTANANIGSDLNKFFSNMNYSGSNYTNGAVWKGQAAGYLTGGSIYARTSVKNIQLMTMTAPNINAGCGGIDLYLGSFSFINGEQIVRFVKQLMSNAVGFAFDLALTTLVPELKAVKDYLQKLAQDINSTNFSSCQAAQALVGSIGDGLNSAKDYMCNSFGNYDNDFSDWVQSRMSCGVGSQATSVTTKAKSDDKFKDAATIANTNLTWYILTEKTKKMFEGDTELKQLMMTLVGSVIYRNDERVLIEPIFDPKLVQALLNGGEAQVYVCDDDKACLFPDRKTISIPTKSGINTKILVLINGIIEKVEQDSPALTIAETDFISSTTVPILKYIIDPMSIQTTRLLMGDITKQISYSILADYLNETVRVFSIAANNTDIPQEGRDKIFELLGKSQEQIAVIRKELQFQENSLERLEAQMRYLRMQASSQFLGEYLSNYQF